MKLTFVPGPRSSKVILEIIREAPGQPLYRDENTGRLIGKVKAIELCENEYYRWDSYYVADCLIDDSAPLPDGFDAKAESAKGFVVKVKTMAGDPDYEPVVSFFLER